MLAKAQKNSAPHRRPPSSDNHNPPRVTQNKTRTASKTQDGGTARHKTGMSGSLFLASKSTIWGSVTTLSLAAGNALGGFRDEPRETPKRRTARRPDRSYGASSHERPPQLVTNATGTLVVNTTSAPVQATRGSREALCLEHRKSEVSVLFKLPGTNCRRASATEGIVTPATFTSAR